MKAVCAPLLLLLSLTAGAVEPVQIKIRDLASVEGVRENPLIGYGMIVGLNGTGDKQQTVFAVQTLAGILQRLVPLGVNDDMAGRAGERAFAGALEHIAGGIDDLGLQAEERASSRAGPRGRDLRLLPGA